MVGDSPIYDVAGAHAAGCALAVLVTRGLDVAARRPSPPHEGAVPIETLEELPRALGLQGPDPVGPFRDL